MIIRLELRDADGWISSVDIGRLLGCGAGPAVSAMRTRLGFESTPAGLGAMGTGEGVFGFVGLFVLSAFLELAWREDPSKEPGNFGDPFGINMYNEEMREKEISNGRMAMISVLGIFAAEIATGKDAIEQFGF